MTKFQKRLQYWRRKKSRVISLMTDGDLSREDRKTEISKINSKIQKLKGFFITEENLKKIKDECWDFVYFFLNNSVDLWNYGDFQLRKEINGLIMPEGFVLQDNQIQPVKLPEFISSFNINTKVNRIRWS